MLEMLDKKYGKKSLYLKEFRIRFLIFSVIIGLFTFPIIHADILFADDHLRASNGLVHFGSHGRILGELLLNLTNISGNISDPGCFFQIASIFILAAPITLLSLILKYNRLSAILTLPFIVCTPFFLQNLSYRYDSFIMSLSLALAVLAVCAQLKQKYFYTILAVVGLLGFYQASLSAFLVLSLLGALWCLFESGTKASVFYLVKAYLCGLAALILYKIQVFCFAFIPGAAFKVGAYAQAHGATNYHLAHILKNFVVGLKYCFADFLHGGVFLSLAGGLLFSITFLLFKLFWATSGKRLLAKSLFIVWGLGICLLSLISIIGPMALLDEMVTDPRVMIGLGPFLTFYFSFFVGKEASWQGWHLVPVSLSAFMLFEVIFGAFLYGNILSEENEFENKITDQMILDTYELVHNQKISIRYAHLETFPFAPKTHKARQLQPWVTHVLANNHHMFLSFSPPEFWIERGAPGSMQVERNEGTSDFFSQEAADRIVATCDYDHYRMAPFYTLYQKGDKIVIDFASSCLKS